MRWLSGAGLQETWSVTLSSLSVSVETRPSRSRTIVWPLKMMAHGCRVLWLSSQLLGRSSTHPAHPNSQKHQHSPGKLRAVGALPTLCRGYYYERNTFSISSLGPQRWPLAMALPVAATLPGIRAPSARHDGSLSRRQMASVGPVSRHRVGGRRSDAVMVTCSADRRSMLSAGGGLVLTQLALLIPADKAQAGGMTRYIKKKDYDPLETYVPAILAAKDQLLESIALLDGASNATEARRLLREGPFSGLRDNIRVVGLYAQKAGVGNSSEIVQGFFSALNDYDTALFKAIRQESELPSDIRDTANAVVKAMDRLLDTVPEDVMQKSEQVFSVVKVTDADSSTVPPASPSNLDVLF